MPQRLFPRCLPISEVRWVPEPVWMLLVKQSLDSSWGFQEVDATRFPDNRDMKMVKLSAIVPSAFTSQEIFLVLISVRGWVWPTLIFPVTPSGIEPATFRLVAQCFSHGVPPLPPSHRKKFNPDSSVAYSAPLTILTELISATKVCCYQVWHLRSPRDSYRYIFRTTLTEWKNIKNF